MNTCIHRDTSVDDLVKLRARVVSALKAVDQLGEMSRALRGPYARRLERITHDLEAMFGGCIIELRRAGAPDDNSPQGLR